MRNWANRVGFREVSAVDWMTPESMQDHEGAQDGDFISPRPCCWQACGRHSIDRMTISHSIPRAAFAQKPEPNKHAAVIWCRRLSACSPYLLHAVPPIYQYPSIASATSKIRNELKFPRKG